MSESAAQPSFSRDEVAQHNGVGDLWVIIDEDVYDLSDFMNEHPGGPKFLLSVAGRDATKKFRKYHRDSILNKYKERFQVGMLRPDSAKETRFRAFFATLGKR